MSGKYDFDDIRGQMQFCTELVMRLNDEIHQDGEGYWSGMKNHIRKHSLMIMVTPEKCGCSL